MAFQIHSRGHPGGGGWPGNLVFRTQEQHRAKRNQQCGNRYSGSHAAQCPGQFDRSALGLEQAFPFLCSDGCELCGGILHRLVFPQADADGGGRWRAADRLACAWKVRRLRHDAYPGTGEAEPPMGAARIADYKGLSQKLVAVDGRRRCRRLSRFPSSAQNALSFTSIRPNTSRLKFESVFIKTMAAQRIRRRGGFYRAATKRARLAGDRDELKHARFLLSAALSGATCRSTTSPTTATMFLETLEPATSRHRRHG